MAEMLYHDVYIAVLEMMTLAFSLAHSTSGYGGVCITSSIVETSASGSGVGQR